MSKEIKENGRKIKKIRCVFDIKCSCGAGFVEPKTQLLRQVKVNRAWTPMRHGVLMDSYWRSVRNGVSDSKEFAIQFAHEVALGMHPIMEKREYDHEPETPFTVDAYKSQVEWLLQLENQVVFEEDGRKDICFNNILAVTSVQKSGVSGNKRSKKIYDKARKEAYEEGEPKTN